MIYFDTSYIVRLYFDELGYDEVRRLASQDSIACCVHGKVETVAAFHRKYREDVVDRAEYKVILNQFEADCLKSAFKWLPISPAVIGRVIKIYETLPADTFLRSADAVHLACASENGFHQIFSNDRHLLSAARHFGIEGKCEMPG